MKFNWEQPGMPASLVGQAGRRRTLSDFKSVLRDAQNQIMSPVDAESMAKELAESGGRNYIEMIRELSDSLANTKKELDASNRKYERLVADLRKRGIHIDEKRLTRDETPVSSHEFPSAADEVDEWEEWNRKFQSLLG